MEGMEEGIIKGKAEGIAEGEQKALTKIAMALLTDGTSIEKISYLTGLSERDIKELMMSKQ